jgi:hypothetical protein
MRVVQKAPYLNTTEKFYIYKETQNFDGFLKEKHAVLPQKVCNNTTLHNTETSHDSVPDSVTSTSNWLGGALNNHRSK